MHVKAMQKARAALARAEQNLASLKASNGFSAIEEHWEQLLDNSNKVFTRLEQAANTTIKGKTYWGKASATMEGRSIVAVSSTGTRNSTHHSIQEIAQNKSWACCPNH